MMLTATGQEPEKNAVAIREEEDHGHIAMSACGLPAATSGGRYVLQFPLSILQQNIVKWWAGRRSDDRSTA